MRVVEITVFLMGYGGGNRDWVDEIFGQFLASSFFFPKYVYLSIYLFTLAFTFSLPNLIIYLFVELLI